MHGAVGGAVGSVLHRYFVHGYYSSMALREPYHRHDRIELKKKGFSHVSRKGFQARVVGAPQKKMRNEKTSQNTHVTSSHT